VSAAFPFVPDLPGVPQVARQFGVLLPPAISINLSAAGSVLAFLFGINVAPVWGIFTTDGDLAIDPDSIREFNMREEWQLPSYPIQDGTLQTYNKVISPQEYSFRMVKGGSIDDRQSFEQQVANVGNSLDGFTIVTPEMSYPNCNCTRFEKTRREAADAYFVIVDIFFQQILSAATLPSTAPVTTNAIAPSGQPSTSLGTVTPISPGPIILPPLQTVGIS
jgi:hypothetical protein